MLNMRGEIELKKISKMWCALTAALLLVVPVTASAQENVIDKEEQTVEILTIDSNLSLEKKADGRVFPKMKTRDQSLTISQQESVLIEMGFTEEELEEMDPVLKEDISLGGGKKVETQTTLRQYYNSADGKKHLVTDENREEIEALRQKDARELSKKSDREINIEPLSYVEEYPFSAVGNVVYQGKTSNAAEFVFKYYNTANWAESPRQLYSDTLAHAWQGFATGVSRESTLTTWVTPQQGGTHYPAVKIEGAYGSSAKMVQGNYYSRHWTIMETVNIPVSNKGTTGKHVARYAHPYSPVSPSLTVGPVSLAYSSFWGDEWTWDTIYMIDSK